MRNGSTIFEPMIMKSILSLQVDYIAPSSHFKMIITTLSPHAKSFITNPVTSALSSHNIPLPSPSSSSSTVLPLNSLSSIASEFPLAFPPGVPSISKDTPSHCYISSNLSPLFIPFSPQKSRRIQPLSSKFSRNNAAPPLYSDQVSLKFVVPLLITHRFTSVIYPLLFQTIPLPNLWLNT